MSQARGAGAETTNITHQHSRKHSHHMLILTTHPGMRVYAIPDHRLGDEDIAEFARTSFKVLKSLGDLDGDSEFWSFFQQAPD